jgi:DNA-binding NarL/FixJ family response regulator
MNKIKSYNILIIDDHPLISEAYKSAFNFIASKNIKIKFSIKTAHNCDVANDLIKDFYTNKRLLNIVFLDIKLPASKDKKLISGEDLGIQINKLLPETKIIVSTTFNNNYRIHSILKNINPFAFLIKNDIVPSEIITAIESVINDTPYYSKTVIKLLRKEVSNDFLLDDIDRKILYELSVGTKMKNLPDLIPLSIAGIEKRKRHLKQIFNIDSLDDRELIINAKDKGFI